MRRTDRLYALVEELRARAPRLMGRGQLARQLEVTPRTVERDILALQQAGRCPSLLPANGRCSRSWRR